MFDFSGELTGKSKCFLIKEQMKVNLIVSLLLNVLYGTPVIIATFIWNAKAWILAVPMVMLLVFSFIPPSRKQQKDFMPIRVFFDLEEETVVHQCENKERFHMINTISKIVDYGEWYYLYFHYGDRDMYFVCQKNLLVTGTIEDFEKMFEDKIVKKK